MKKAKLKNYIRMDLKRLFSSVQFYIAVIGILGINVLNILDETGVVTESSVLYLFNGRAVVGAFEMLLIFFAILPYCLSFCVDWDYGYYKIELIRGNRNRYLISKIITTVIGTLVATIAGYILFVLILRLFYPLFPRGVEEIKYYMQLTPTAFQEAAFSRIPQLYFLVTIIPEALMYCFLACVALLISSKDTNRFIVLSSPIIFYYIFNFLCGTLRLPSILMWQSQKIGVMPDLPWIQNLFVTVGYYLLWIGLVGILFLRNVRRRIQFGH
ncbi:hypothetical protein LQE92_12450 [Lacrimispora sp. NSJ-141]|uniref:ABC-2 family transporter protein n=1 Tax=Lientehia hominis TaxID=2897778 RepID=A0AAP2RLM0_9FIRM|nr:hypothetical protein [Lientehia hominis]MCD2493425.1 hypothetical protein [Lientehia hominis]